MLGSALSLFIALSGQGHFAPDAKLPWVVQGFELAYREKDLLGYPDDERWSRGDNRYPYAVMLHASVTNRLRRLEIFLEKPAEDIERASLLRGNGLLPFYRRAAKEFRPELNSLGVEADFGIDRIPRLTQQIAQTSTPKDFLFKDVPPAHWAAKAIGDLRALGLLDGYPDGRYRG